jgi:hypothetical protein
MLVTSDYCVMTTSKGWGFLIAQQAFYSYNRFCYPPAASGSEGSPEQPHAPAWSFVIRY